MNTAETIAEQVFGPPAAQPDRVFIGAPHHDAHRPADLTPHPDKAISQRATILAALADGTSRIRGLADCHDTRNNLRALARLGVAVRPEGPGTVTITGRDVAAFAERDVDLDAGNSATSSRLLLALLAGGRGRYTVTGNASLRGRPMGEVIRPLRQLGAHLTELDAADRLPVRIDGVRLHGGEVAVRADSAQPVSALLYAAVSAAGPVIIRRRTAARDHTERLLRWTGVQVEESETRLRVLPARPRAFDLAIPGDPSAAAFLAALHLAAAPGRELALHEVCLNPRRTGFFAAVAAMGAKVDLGPRGADGPEPVGTVRVSRTGRLNSAVISGPQLIQSAIDELPLLAALAATADGPVVIADAAELRGKDTDRIATTLDLLTAFGVRARANADGLEVTPTPPQGPPVLELPADHRVVFAAFVLALLAGGGTELRGVAAAATSNPAALGELARFARIEAR